MNIIDNNKKGPTKITKEIISTRRIPLEEFPMFTQEDPPKVIVGYQDACKRAGIPKKIDIHNLPLAPEVNLRRTMKSKVVGEGTSIRTSKAAKK